MSTPLPPIYRDCRRLLVHTEEMVRRFARYHKYTVGADLRRAAMQLMRTVNQAVHDKTRQSQYVERLVWQVDDYKLGLQLAMDVGAFKHGINRSEGWPGLPLRQRQQQPQQQQSGAVGACQSVIGRRSRLGHRAGCCADAGRLPAPARARRSGPGDRAGPGPAHPLEGAAKDLSFPRRRESSCLMLLGSRLRGSDESRVLEAPGSIAAPSPYTISPPCPRSGDPMMKPAAILFLAALAATGPALGAERYSIVTAAYPGDAANNAVVDARTGLTWRRCSEGQAWSGSACTGAAGGYSHEEALSQAKAQTGWRLPNVKELASLADRSRSGPAIDPTAFPGTPSTWYWTSSPYVSAGYNTWGVNFDYGGVYGYGRVFSHQVRLVHASQ